MDVDDIQFQPLVQQDIEDANSGVVCEWSEEDKQKRRTYIVYEVHQRSIIGCTAHFALLFMPEETEEQRMINDDPTLELYAEMEAWFGGLPREKQDAIVVLVNNLSTKLDAEMLISIFMTQFGISQEYAEHMSEWLQHYVERSLGEITRFPHAYVVEMFRARGASIFNTRQEPNLKMSKRVVTRHEYRSRALWSFETTLQEIEDHSKAVFASFTNYSALSKNCHDFTHRLKSRIRNNERTLTFRNRRATFV